MLHMQGKKEEQLVEEEHIISVKVLDPRQLNNKHAGKDLVYITTRICRCV